MTLLRSGTARVTSACLVQLLLLPAAVAGPLSARLAGEEVVMEVAPVDPVDPFRGAYVALRYPGLPDSARPTEGEHAATDVAYVPLVRSGDVWVGEMSVPTPPASGPFLRCADDHWRLRCGIESWFAPQQEAAMLARAVSDGRLVGRLRVDGRGNAALVALESQSES